MEIVGAPSIFPLTTNGIESLNNRPMVLPTCSLKVATDGNELKLSLLCVDCTNNCGSGPNSSSDFGDSEYCGYILSESSSVPSKLESIANDF